MRHILLLLALFLSFALRANTQLSEEAKISLLTAAPGPAIYQLFGHSAIRVNDPVNGIDDVYNWGTFDFETPNFTWKFMKGRLDYCLSVDPFFLFYPSYVKQQRSVYEHELLLSPAQKQDMFDYMNWNALEENRYYRYDFFFDNCATRIRDIIDSIVAEPIHWPESELPADQSFRQLIDPYLAHTPFLDLGIDLLLGSPSDATSEVSGTMFLPDHLMLAFEGARIGEMETSIPLTAKPIVIYQSPENDFPSPGIKPWMISLTVFMAALLVSMVEWRRGIHLPFFDGILFGFTGLLGLFMCFMWFGTDHTVLPWNLNLIWAWPFSFFFLPWIWRKNIPTWTNIYFNLYTIATAVCLISIPILPQEIHKGIIFFLFALLIRSFSRSSFEKYLIKES